jgi:hypothetical protein
MLGLYSVKNSVLEALKRASCGWTIFEECSQCSCMKEALTVGKTESYLQNRCSRSVHVGRSIVVGPHLAQPMGNRRATLWAAARTSLFLVMRRCSSSMYTPHRSLDAFVSSAMACRQPEHSSPLVYAGPRSTGSNPSIGTKASMARNGSGGKKLGSFERYTP